MSVALISCYIFTFTGCRYRCICIACRTVSTIRKDAGVNDVHLVTMVTHVLALNLTAVDACVLLAHQATSESV